MEQEPAVGATDILVEDIHSYMVALVGLGGEPVRGKTKLQKIFFLLANDEPEISCQLDYFPHSYGPYSEVLDHELEYLKNVGAISEESNSISLTSIGRKAEREIRGTVDPKVLGALEEYKELLNDLTSNEMLAFIYATFPDMAGKSVEYENIKNKIEDLIMSLVKKDKISSQRAAELLGVTQSKIFHNMNKMGLRVFE